MRSLAIAGALLALACEPSAVRPDAGSGDAAAPDELTLRLRSLVLSPDAAPPPDPTNAYADDPAAARLGQAWFFDRRFAGPLLAHDNTGGPGTLGHRGEVGRVSCADCHVPEHGFVDTRSTRGQLSLASGWTRRRTQSLLDVAQAQLLTWGGRRDTGYSIVFGVIESPLELNSSRLFVAQEIARSYREEYEAIFGPLPALDAYEELAPEEAGCEVLPEDPRAICERPGIDDPEVTRVVVSFGKAIDAYVRQLSCGPGRFDAWVNGDEDALTAEEQAGARLFVGRGGCIGCHSGPYFSDQQFHNVGVPGSLSPFTGVDTAGDRGAAVDLAAAREDWLSSRGAFSDGDDGRLDRAPAGTALEGAFRTPMLRCAGRRPSYFHNGEYRSLHDVVQHFIDGGSGARGHVGTSELAPLDLSSEERDQLVAFLRALDGPGPRAELLVPPPEE